MVLISFVKLVQTWNNQKQINQIVIQAFLNFRVIYICKLTSKRNYKILKYQIEKE